MTQQDYILRLIEQFGQMLIALRNRILGREVGGPELKDELRAVVQATGLDLDMARSVTPETLLMMIAPGGDIEPGRAWLVAETLYLDGLHAYVDGRPDDARRAWQRAVPLYEMLGPHGIRVAGLPEAEERLEEIGGRLDAIEEGGAR